MTAGSPLLDRLSVIIVTWNGDGLLEDCLSSLYRVYGNALETVVVDNAGSSSTKAVAERYGFVKYVAAPGNPGFAGGNNIGLKSAGRDYILLLNNDTVVSEDSFSPLLEFLAAHEKAGIVQGTMEIPGFGLDDCGTEMTPVGIQRHLNRGKPLSSVRLVPRKVFAAKGAMLMFKRALLKDVGGFLFYDHFKSYYEETDFCHRARNAGWETWFVPTPPIKHLCGATSTRFPRRDIWTQYIANTLYSFHRNYGFWGHVFTLPCFACAAMIKAPRAFFGALRLNAKRS